MRKKIQHAVLLFASVSIFNLACQKETKQLPRQEVQEEIASEQNRNGGNDHSKQTKNFSADVVIKWLNLQLDLLRVPLAAGTGSQAAERAQAYCGIALYEAVVPGMRDYRSLEDQLKAFPSMPDTKKDKAYHWGASANAALAYMNRKLFPTTSATNKTNIDNLENSLQSLFASEVSAATLERSIKFGREVATRVYDWAATDGSANVNPPYVPQFIGPAFWVQSVSPTWLTTPPNNPLAVNPYAYQRRLLVPGVKNGTDIAPLPPYSTNPASRFYKMVKDVYDKSQNLTPEQTAAAIYTRDAPGYPGGGAYVALLSQVISKATCKLDVAAVAYAKTGIAQSDATIILFIQKYTYNVVRPVNYIRDVLGHSTWLPLFNTPGHPEFPSGHSTISAAVATILTDVFGKHFQFTIHTYDYLGLPARSYNSFNHLAKEVSDARVFAGIHYQETDDKSRVLGEKVSRNVLRKVEFLKNKDHHHNHHHNHH
jgi:hypothetical protein